MKKIVTLIAVCMVHPAIASHLFGGFITTKHAGNRQVEITVTLLADPNSIASQNLNAITLHYGDGTSDIIQRVSFGTDDHEFRTHIYTTTHQYQADGTFMISYSDPNLVDNIINVNFGQSGNNTLLLESAIKINTIIGVIENPVPLAYTFPVALPGQALSYNPTFASMDGDSVAYQLIETSTLPNYQLPEELTMNPYSGMITWGGTTVPGLYLIQYKVSNFRNGLFCSSTYVTQMLKVIDLPVTFPGQPLIPNTDLTTSGWYRHVITTPGPVQQTFSLVSSDTNYKLEVYSELMYLNGQVSGTSTDSSRSVRFSWDALSTLVRPSPYFVTFRIQSSLFSRVSKDYNVAFYHGSPLTTALSELPADNNSVSVYPNPSLGGSCIFLFSEKLPPGTLHIYASTGKEVGNIRVAGDSHIWDHSANAPGIYFYRIALDNGQVMNGKIVLK